MTSSPSPLSLPLVPGTQLVPGFEQPYEDPIARLTRQLFAMEAELKAYKEENVSLQKENRALKLMVGQLQRGVQGLEATVKKLEEVNHNRQFDIQSLQTENLQMLNELRKRNNEETKRSGNNPTDDSEHDVDMSG